ADMMETAFLSHHPRVALGRPAGDLTSEAAVGNRPRDAGLRVLIADDEPPARHKLRKYLAAERDVVAVDECSDGAGALEVARRAPPDLLLLDVQLPVLDGFEVLRRLGRERRPEVVFVSAHEEYPIPAFEGDAPASPVKPFDQARFRAALDRVRRRLAASSSVGARSAFDGAVRRPGDPRRLVVRSRGRILSLGLDEIESIESDDNYVRLHTARQTYPARDAMSAVEARLDPRQFLRIHRRAIVTLDWVSEVRPLPDGAYEAALWSGRVVRVGRKYRRALRRALGFGAGGSTRQTRVQATGVET